MSSQNETPVYTISDSADHLALSDAIHHRLADARAMLVVADSGALDDLASGPRNDYLFALQRTVEEISELFDAYEGRADAAAKSEREKSS